MKLEECRGKRILWGMTPEQAFQAVAITSVADLEAERARQGELIGAWFYINVWNCQATLALYEQGADGIGQSYLIEDSPFTSEELEEAVRGQGGAINRSGWYALPEPLQERLRKEL